MTCIDKWELIKIRCEFSQKYSTSRKICIDKLKHDLERKVDLLLTRIDSDRTMNRDLQKELLETQTELDKIYANKCKGAGIRARVRWMEEGEKNTKYFMNLEKRNAKKKIFIN